MATALLAGASGLVGGECLDVLCDEPRYSSVRVVTRRDLGGRVRHPKVRQHIVDFDDLEASSDVLRADHVFCTLGTTIRKAGSQERFRAVDYGYPLALARVTAVNGATHFSLVSSLGANPESRFFYSRVKGDLEQALTDLALPSLAIFRPSVIAGDRGESRPFERLAERLLRLAPRSVRPVPARTIARAMVAVALEEPPGVTVVLSRDIAGHARADDAGRDRPR
jgi:uncharacterized protein YbjT (DUF2867 family)